MKLKCTCCNGLGYIEADFTQLLDCNICSKTGIIDFGEAKPPYAYHVQDESAWDLDDVRHYYPEIVGYWNSKDVFDTRINPCGPVDEDCLYLNDEWYSYCRYPYEWKHKDDKGAMASPVGKQRNKTNGQT